MSEKTEKASPYKLQKAKEKGQVSKSVELNTYMALLITLGLVTLLWPHYMCTLQNNLSHLLSMAGHVEFSVDTLSYFTNLISSELISLWLPLAFTFVLSIILCTIAQTGLIFATAALTPNFKRLDISQGFKKLCSINSLFDTLKTLFKLLCSFLVLFCIFKNQLPVLVQTSLSKPANNTSLMMNFVLYTGLKLIFLLLILAFLDKKFTRWKFNKEQRMTKHEVKEEYKQKEGDPKIKQKRRQLQAQLRQKNAALNQIKTAHVIITNPTHIAIALKYERGVMPAPQIVCKAQDKMVVQVKELAKKHSIPIIEHKTLARMLHYTTELNQYISKDLFPLTAQIFRDLYSKEAAQ